MMKIDERKLQHYYDVVPITLDDDDTNRSINNGDQILILQYAKSQANHSQREPAHSTSPCRVVGMYIEYFVVSLLLENSNDYACLNGCTSLLLIYNNYCHNT